MEKRELFTRRFGGAVRVGIEATGHTHWFEAMLAELGHELWMGDAAKIRASVIRKQKTDARDAAHLLDLLRQGRFPRIWRLSPTERDLRNLVWHRQKLVWMRGAVKNQLHALAMGEGVCRKKKLFTVKGRKELESLALGPWASYRRRMFDELAAATAQLDLAVEQAAKNQPLAVRLMTHPGVGPVTSLAFVLIIGPVERFQRSKQVVSYLGLNPQEHSSGGKQRLGAISKQGNPMMRSLLVEAGSHSGALRSRTETHVSTFEVSPWGFGSEGCRGPQAGRKDVLDAAQHGGLCAAGSHARQPVGHPGGEQSITGLIGCLASTEESGSLNNESWFEKTE